MVEFFDDYLYTHRLTGLIILLIIYTQTYRVEFLDYYLHTDLRFQFLDYYLHTDLKVEFLDYYLHTHLRGRVS